MAKKHTQTIEIDIVTKGVDTAEKAIAGIDSSHGELYKHAQKVSKAIEKIRNITTEYGDNIPITKAKELANYMKIISEETSEMADLDEIVVFNKKESDHLKKISSEIDTIKNKLKEIKKEKINIPVKMEQDRIEDLKSQKTAKGADGKSISLTPLKNADGSSKFNSKADLVNLSKSADPKVAQAAQAALHQLSVTAEKASAKVAALEQEYTKLNGTLQQKNEEYNNLSTTIRTLTDEEKVAFETTSKFTAEQVKHIEQATEASQKEGAEFVRTSKSIDKHNTSLKGAVKQLFSWTAVWNLGKRMLKEAVRTVTEMDEALTGMAVVTSMSREETMQLVPAIQTLARETSTAMTEVANLITEYTRQGRTLTEAFILAEETAKAAKIAGISAAASIQYMTSTINGFNMAASEAAHVSDVFANVAAISATDYEQLAIALSKVSAQANLAGMSMEYTTALLAKGIETTQEAPESIGTALKTIVARMRELSDYGKTLEDGASVNKVESALASAGIQLRDVNGEFRELEDVFNELGPKWDSLNTMQQQAIAQAVAGTRQQSRFVAIMQDWERTQELAAEAQDSAGASAAQYYEQAQGMEAAMTNLTTAWQSFIQSLTSSKFVINVIKIATKMLDGLTNVMSIGGDFTKSFVAGVVSVIAVVKGLQKISQFKNALSNFVAQNTAKEEESNKEITNEKVKQLASEKDISEEQARQLLNNKKQLEFEREKLKLQLQEAQNKREGETFIQDKIDNNPNINKENYQKMLEKHGSKLDAKVGFEGSGEEKQLQNDLNTVNQANGVDPSATVELEYNWKQQLVMLEQESQQIQLAKIDAQIQENEELQRKLELENAITQAKIDQLNTEAGASTTTDERKAQIAKEVDKLTSKKTKNEKLLNKLTQKGNKLDSKRSKVLKGEVKDRTKIKNILNTMVNKLGKKFGVDTNKISKTWKGLTGIFGKMKSQNDANNVSLSKLLTGEQERVKKYDELIKKGSFINENGETQKLTQIELDDLSKRKIRAEENIQNIQAAQQNLGSQGLVTQQQAGQLLQIEQATQAGILTTQQGQVTAEGAETAAQAAGLPTEVAEAGANIASSASQPYGVGLPFAIMGIALLAAVGLGAGIAGIVSAASGAGAKRQDKAAEEEIQKNNASIYEKRKENTTLQTDLDEYRELYNKTYRTDEENQRLEELTESLQEVDESFAGLSGESLMGAVSGKISDNTDSINHLMNSNFDTALSMNSLEDSLIGQQAVTAKLIDSQEDLIASNRKLWETNNAQLNKNVEDASRAMAEELAQSFDYESHLQTDNWGAGDYATTIATTTAWGAGIGTAINAGAGTAVGAGIGVLVGTIGAIIEDVSNANQRAEEQENAAKALEYYNSKIVDMAVTMETEISRSESTLASQIKTYSELENTLKSDLEQHLLSSQYGVLDFMAEMTTVNADDTETEAAYKKQVLDNIDKLTELGVVTEESIIKLAETFSKFETKKNEAEIILGKMTSTHDDWGRHSTLADVAKEYGAGENFTAAELREKMMQEVKYKDGEAARDKNNNYKERHGHGVNNEEFTNIVDYLDTIIASGYGDISQSTLEGIIDVISTGDPSEMFTDILNGMADAVDEGMDPKEQAQAMMDAYDLNSTGAKAYIAGTRTTAQGLYEQADKLFEQGKADEANEMRAQAAEYMSLANEFEAELQNSYRAMVGDMTTTELNDFMEQFNSSLENAQNVKDAIAEGGSIDAEGYDYLMNNVIPTLQKELGDEFDPTEFLQQVQAGSVQALDRMDEYLALTTDSNLDKLARNIVTKEDALTEAQNNLNEAISEGDKTAIQEAQAKVRLAEADLAYAQARYTETEKTLASEKELLALQRRKNSLERKRDLLENQENILKNYKDQIAILQQLADIHQKERKNAIEKTAKQLGITEEQLEAYLNMEKGLQYNTKLVEWANNLSENGLNTLEAQLETIYEIDDAYNDAVQGQEDLNNAWFEHQVDQQTQLLDMYKSKLEDEQEALQDSLDKRRDMYEKYFDALDEQESDESFEEQQARLQKAISSLSTATDATSLSKLKEYQEQLQELEDEQRQTERDRRRDATMEGLDNQSEAIDQYYEDRLENEQALWTEISNMQESEITDLMTKYNQEFQNATDLNQAYMLLSYKQLHAEIAKMMGNTEDAARATADHANYKRWMEQYAKDQTIGKYDPTKTYSKGGLVDYTGLAMVHGSSSQPEAFLNANQTALFSKLASNLEVFYTKTSPYAHNDVNHSNNVVIESFTVAVDATLTDNNVQQTGESLADALLEGLRRTGISVNMKK